MNSPQISIIVPIYKVEQYLQRCIDSVLAQDLTDWELILVDDGSPDRCPQIADDAALKDERIRVIHKQNEGALVARYIGFKEARGEYLVFLDSDDWLLPGALQILYDAITSDGGYDVVKSMVHREDENGKSWIEHYDYNDVIISSCEEYKRAVFYGRINPYLHSGIYRKGIFDENAFLPLIECRISMGEDWIENVGISSKVNNAICIPIATHVYYFNNESIMTSTVRSTQYAERIQKAMANFINDSEKEFKNEMILKLYQSYVSSFFRPENDFSRERYCKIVDFISDETNYKALKKRVKPLYIIFLNHKRIFRIYSALYRFLYLYIRQRGVRKKIIM